MEKRGQGIFGISFGVIFSIIIIIFIVAVAIYAIVSFLNLNKCAQVGLFFSELQEEIDRAWQSQFYRAPYEGSLPSSGLLRTGAKNVCFGDIMNSPLSSSADQQIRDKLKNEYSIIETHNIFIYPPESACGGDFFSTKIEHINPTVRFFCVNVSNGKVPMVLRKSQGEALVNITAT